MDADFVFEQVIDNRTRFKLVHINEHNINTFREGIDLEFNIISLVFNYVRSYKVWSDTFEDKSTLNSIVELVFPNSSSDLATEYANKINEYYLGRIRSYSDYNEFFMMMLDYVGTVSHLKKLLDPKHDVLSKCNHFFLGMIMDNENNVLMCMSVSADENYKNQNHMYIFRSILNQIKSIIDGTPIVSNISIKLHSLCTYAVYKSFPNGTNKIIVRSQPLPYMKALLSKYVEVIRSQNPAFICGFRFEYMFIADSQFMLLWKSLK